MGETNAPELMTAQANAMTHVWTQIYGQAPGIGKPDYRGPAVIVKDEVRGHTHYHILQHAPGTANEAMQANARRYIQHYARGGSILETVQDASTVWDRYAIRYN